MQETMTLHAALAELKLIDKKINSSLSSFNPIGIKNSQSQVNNSIPEEEFRDDAKSKYDSITANIERKHRIKSAILQANSSNHIEVGGRKMTIAEAIHYRNIIDLKKSLRTHIQNARATVVSQMEHGNKQLEADQIQLAKTILQDNTITEVSQQVQDVTRDFHEKRKLISVDPINCKKVVDELEEEIDKFIHGIDSALSVANATISIEI